MEIAPRYGTGTEVMLSFLHSLAHAILGKTGKPDRLDMATRMAMDADFSDRGEPIQAAREPFRKGGPDRGAGANSRRTKKRAKSIYPSGNVGSARDAEGYF
jgi:hypothetical protein